MVDWSYDGDHTKDTMLGAAAQRVEARQRFGIDVARPNVAGLVKAGVEVSSDRRTRRNYSSGGGDYFRRDLQRYGEGVDARASLHICLYDYNSLFPHIEAMDECYELQLEYPNRHFRELGTKAEDRPGYDVLERLGARHGKFGLGVRDIHTNFMVPPQLGRDRILCAARVLGPERIEVNTAASSAPALGRLPGGAKELGRGHPAY